MPVICKMADSCALMAACHPVKIQLVRGALGLTLLWAALFSHAHPLLAGLEGVGVVACFRGCPVCWTVGMFQALERSRGPLPNSL